MSLMSMTGFGRARFRLGQAAYRLEMRSLNHRFLDFHVRLPWIDAELEKRLTDRVRGRLNRGRLDISVLEEGGADSGSLQLNRPMAQGLARALDELASTLACDPATAASLLGAPRGLLCSGAAGLETEEIWEGLGPSVDQALLGLLQMREQEGTAHQQTLQQHLDDVAGVARAIGRLAAAEPRRLQQTLEQRLEGLTVEQGPLDPARLAQEIALLAERCDIAEELDRLQSHNQQMEGILSGEEPAVGRKIEFLLQEFHRELNTIGSKTHHPEISHMIVDAKASVEKMRGMGMNIE